MSYISASSTITLVTVVCISAMTVKMTIMTDSTSVGLARVMGHIDVALPQSLTSVETVGMLLLYSPTDETASPSDACFHSGLCQLCHGSTPGEFFSFRFEVPTSILLAIVLMFAFTFLVPL